MQISTIIDAVSPCVCVRMSQCRTLSVFAAVQVESKFSRRKALTPFGWIRACRTGSVLENLGVQIWGQAESTQNAVLQRVRMQQF